MFQMYESQVVCPRLFSGTSYDVLTNYINEWVIAVGGGFNQFIALTLGKCSKLALHDQI